MGNHKTAVGSIDDFHRHDLCLHCKHLARMPHLINCTIADKVTRLQKKHDILLAVWACPKFEPLSDKGNSRS